MNKECHFDATLTLIEFLGCLRTLYNAENLMRRQSTLRIKLLSLIRSFVLQIGPYKGVKTIQKTRLHRKYLIMHLDFIVYSFAIIFTEKV